MSLLILVLLSNCDKIELAKDRNDRNANVCQVYVCMKSINDGFFLVVVVVHSVAFV